jgi:hypothetical protein
LADFVGGALGAAQPGEQALVSIIPVDYGVADGGRGSLFGVIGVELG